MESDDVQDRDFFLERSALYSQKALLMSSSAEALLSHAPRWFNGTPDSTTDRDEILVGFALAIESASGAHERKHRTLEALAHGAGNVDALLMEGTQLSRAGGGARALSEAELETDCMNEIQMTSGMALAFLLTPERRPAGNPLQGGPQSAPDLCH